MTDRELRPLGDTQVLASVSNAARLLKEFGKGDREIGVSELSRRLGLGKSTTHRLLHTLTVERLLEQDPDTGCYRLALTMHELGASVQSAIDLHTAANPVIEQLRNLTKETVQIAVLDGRHVVYVERRESPHTIRLFGRVGHRNDAHCTSTGKVLLAHLPQAELDRVLSGWRLPRKTQYTIADQASLRVQLHQVLVQGWAENVNETELGVASIAAPIRDLRGTVVAALSIAGPIQRMEGATLRRYVRPVTEAAAAISRRLGWVEPAARQEGTR
ncbi:MAG: helix-turn-helix domain-containing protein [Frankiales bacterium]|nr:helix-turn-helix domain-containing protein [Frankiales bacterium]